MEVKRAIPKGDTNRTTKLFISGLSSDTSEDHVRESFMEAGFEDKITSVKVMTNRETNESRGFGFVDFRESEDVDDVLTLKKITIMVSTELS